MDRIKELLEKLNWSTVILLVGMGAAFFFYTIDSTDIEAKEAEIAATQGRISTLDRQIQEAKEFEQQFEEKKRHYAELVKELQKLQGTLPKQFFLPDLLSDLLREAKQLEVEIISIRPDAKEEVNELYNSLGFDIEARGTFLQFFILLDRMSNMKRLVTVKSFEIQREGDGVFLALGGAEGAFAGSRMLGGRSSYLAIKGKIRVETYRFRGGANPAPSTAGGGN